MSPDADSPTGGWRRLKGHADTRVPWQRAGMQQRGTIAVNRIQRGPGDAKGADDATDSLGANQ
jgi:hypothetical protein